MGKEIEKLEKLGFSNYEAKVFFALYQGSVMSAAEIAKDAKIPRTSVYQILRSFASKGYCNEITTPTKQLFEIIESKVIEEKLELQLEREYRSGLTSIKDCFNEIKPLYKTKQPSEYKTDVELIKGYNLYREAKFLDLVKNSSKGIMVMNRFRGDVSSKIDVESKRLFKRGGYIKSIYENSTNFKLKINDKWQNVTKQDLIHLCEEFAKHGEDIRFLNEVPQILAVFDERIVYISLFDEKIPARDSSDIIIKNKRFASFVISLFNLYWDKADTLEILKKELE
jgi:sugar-specific transcriptional regulator TrmB